MKIAIVHYHLQRGGVTRVIEHSIKALSAHNVTLVVLTGQPPIDKQICDYRVIPGLQYEANRPNISSRELGSAMEKAATAALGGPPDIWHIHNHSLGKNMVLPEAILGLARQGYHLLLHIHDFAEDGRPANYHLMLEKLAHGKTTELSRILYPQADHIHYAVLNSRDFTFLNNAGIPSGHLHHLPNSVHLGNLKFRKESWKEEPKEQLWLYPTRAIRRKNIGEFLLWSAVAPKGHNFATTMGPENPKERQRYETWMRLAKKLRLPIEFELSAKTKCSFEDLLLKARSLVTTSIAEGFGLAFLEPWLVGRPICGRDLPEVTMEFRKSGIELPFLYERLDIPVKWLGMDRIVKSVAVAQKQWLQAYGRIPKEDCIERVIDSWIQNNCVDFGRLDEKMQEEILHKIVLHPGSAAELAPMHLPNPTDYLTNLETNRSILLEKFSLSVYGKRLINIYKQLANCTVESPSALNSEVLLDHFLAPERLALLRVD